MARKYLAVILFAMGILQVLSWSDFVVAIESYQVFDGFAAELVSAVLVLSELGAGLLLLTNARQGSVASFVVFSAWTIIAVQAFVRGLEVPNCGCFGRWFSQRLRWWVLLEDVYLLGLSAWIFKSTTNPKGEDDINRADLKDHKASESRS